MVGGGDVGGGGGGRTRTGTEWSGSTGGPSRVVVTRGDLQPRTKSPPDSSLYVLCLPKFEDGKTILFPRIENSSVLSLFSVGRRPRSRPSGLLHVEERVRTLRVPATRS